MPNASCSTLAIGARQLVVHDAFETMVMSAVSDESLTPCTMVASAPSPGAEINTRLAPAVSSIEALSRAVKMPVHSIATSTPASGSLVGSRSAVIRIGPQVLAPWVMVMVSPSTTTAPGKRPWTLS